MARATRRAPSARRLRWLGSLLLCWCCAAQAAPEDARLPVPEAAACKAVVTAVKKEFRDEYRSKDQVVLRTLAGRLLEQAQVAEDDPARRYALLQESVKLARSAGDIGLALSAVARLGEAFQVEPAPLAFTAVNAIGKRAKQSGLLAESASACIDLTGGALTAEDGGTAGKAISAATKYAKKAKLDGLAARASALSKLVIESARISVH